MGRLELMDTVELMGSSDYRDRFVAEYIQLKTRRDKLKLFITRIVAAGKTADEVHPVQMPKYDCPLSLLRDQLRLMNDLLDILEIRAVIEDIDLEDVALWLEYRKREAQKKEPERNSVVDERATVAVSDTDDEWELLSEVIGKIIERGLVADADEEKLMAAGLSVLHKIKKLEEPCKESKKLTPDEIKNGLENCISENCNCNNCPAGQTLKDDCECGAFLMEKALEYIKKLEKERT